jgi:hypothetical protein
MGIYNDIKKLTASGPYPFVCGSGDSKSWVNGYPTFDGEPLGPLNYTYLMLKVPAGFGDEINSYLDTTYSRNSNTSKLTALNSTRLNYSGVWANVRCALF